MSPETLARAADPFFTTKGVGKGTGLGLSMVHGLAEQSNGRLVVESEVGQGTTVSLFLPVADIGTPAQVVEKRGDNAARAGSPPEPRRPLRILAVDDDPLVRLTLAALLEDMGHVVVSAESGRQAVDAFDGGGRFDLLVTDYAMPGMTGAELARSVRGVQPELPIVVATGYAELALGSVHGITQLSKPFDRKALASAIEAAIGATPTRGP
jgi:CheY-like chemotaxis protein